MVYQKHEMMNEDPLYGNVSIRWNTFLSAFGNLIQLGYEVNKEKESSASSKHEITWKR